MAYSPQFQGQLPYSWGQQRYMQQSRPITQLNQFESSLPLAWMSTPKTPTLEEQQQAIPEYQELAKAKEEISKLEQEKLKKIEDRKKTGLSEQIKSAREKTSNAYKAAKNIDASYWTRAERNEDVPSFNKRQLEAYAALEAAQEEEARLADINDKLQGKKDSYKTAAEEEYKKFQEAFKKGLPYSLEDAQVSKSRFEFANKRKPKEIDEAVVSDFFSDIETEFQKKKEEAVKNQNIALSVFEEAKKKVKYRPPAGVPLDARGIPITA